MTEREDLIRLSNSPNPEIARRAKERLGLIQEQEKANLDKDFSEVINQMNNLIKEVYMIEQKGVDEIEVEKIIAQKLKNWKIDPTQLPKSIGSGGASQTIILNPSGVEISRTKSDDNRALDDVLMSDFESKNNVYLYGAAGTGKTYTAGKIADKINYKLITLNCNQFTSPTDIIGGQTIDGYQEGRLSEAWANLNLGLNRYCKPYDGALLLLDELPKLDPNTAGILNDALSKIKDPKKTAKDCDTGEEKISNPIILNGRGEQLEMKNIFVIATGNSLLNEANKDYEANFKQDLSLQDRFAGSCYKITYNYDFEYLTLSKNHFTDKSTGITYKVDLTFVFNFLALLRQAIDKLELSGIAFVSTRLMISSRDTFNQFLLNREKDGNKQIPKPKTLKMGIMSFLSLFSDDQRDGIRNEMGDAYTYFMSICDAKDKETLKELETASDRDRITAETILGEAKRQQEAIDALTL